MTMATSFIVEGALMSRLMLLLFFGLVVDSKAVKPAPPPLIFIPGLTESNLQVNSSAAPSYCNNTGEWVPLWPATNQTFATQQDVYCFFYQLAAYFNTSSQSLSSTPGVQVRAVDFGHFAGLGSFVEITVPYELEGWIPGWNFYAAPYDWRFPSAGLDSYYEALKDLVEYAYAESGERVNLLAPSYGPQITLGFLHRMSQEWKDTYIAWFLAESPIWSGTPTALQAYVSGLGTDQSGAEFYRQLASTTFSGPWIFPRAGDTNTTWGSKEALISTPSKTYTAYDYFELLDDLGFASNIPGFNYVVTEPDLYNFSAPGVDTLVTYGYGLGTAGSFIYSADFAPNQFPVYPEVINATDTGDSLITVRSSLRSTEWAAEQASLGKKLLHRSYLDQYHAYCIIPQGGQCFYDVISLLKNGTFPPSTSHSSQFTSDIIP